ncbi:hypothetical protein AMTRI_Chr09g42000 [Amborella trichopoda]
MKVIVIYPSNWILVKLVRHVYINFPEQIPSSPEKEHSNDGETIKFLSLEVQKLLCDLFSEVLSRPAAALYRKFFEKLWPSTQSLNHMFWTCMMQILLLLTECFIVWKKLYSRLHPRFEFLVRKKGSLFEKKKRPLFLFLP